jgi:TonB family protein
MSASDTEKPSGRRGGVVAAIYAGCLIALASFGLGRTWDAAGAFFERWSDYVSVAMATRHAFETALLNNAAMPRPNPVMPHTITVYPAVAQRRGEQGDVIMQVLVRPDGHVGDVHVLQSSGSSQLDAAALVGVGYWSYIPAVRNHKAIESWVRVRVQFRLKGDQA